MKCKNCKLKTVFQRLTIYFLIMTMICVLPCTASAKNMIGDKSTNLTINVIENGNIVKTINYTIEQLQKMTQKQVGYTTVDSMPAPVFSANEGVMLEDLLTNANIDENNIQSFKFTSTDGYMINVSKKYLLDTPRYYFPKFKDNSDEGKAPVKPILALKNYQERFTDAPEFDKMSDYDSIRLCFGQSTPDELTTNKFAKWVNQIDIIEVPSGTGSVLLNTPKVDQSYESNSIVSISGETKSLKAVTVNVYDPDGNTVYTAKDIDTTSNNLTTKFTLGNDAKDGYYTIKVSADGLVQDYTQEFIVANQKASVRLKSPAAVQTFNPGDKVTINGLATKIATVNVSVTGPDNKNIFEKDNIDTNSDSFTTDFTLDNTAPTGDYIITVSSPQMSIPYKVKFNVNQKKESNTGYPDEITLSWTGDPKTTETVSWRTTSDITQEYIQYIPTSNFYGDFNRAQQINAAESALYTGYNHFEATLTGLSPNTRYIYRIGKEGTWSEPATFITAGTENKFSFLYMGDVQEGYSDWGTMLNSAYTENPDLKFGLLGGDLINDGDSSDECHQFLSNASPVFNQISLMPARGNHEEISTVLWNSLPVPQNGPEGYKGRFYSFDYGNCHIAVLDSNHMLSPSDTDYVKITTWLQNDLKNSNQRWKFVVLHHPPYPVVSDGNVKNIQNYWIPIFEQCNVDVVFNGHQHVYMRTKPMKEGKVQESGNGVIYVMGNAGTKYYAAGSNCNYISKEIANVSNYQIINIDQDTFTLTSKEAGGQIIDSFTIKKDTNDKQVNGAYTITPIMDNAYKSGRTSDGINTMTVNNGVFGMRYFTVQITPVKEHSGVESVAFVHLRNGVQIDLNVVKADFDAINKVQSGFNVLPGDVIKAYIVDNLSYEVDKNPIILE